MFIKNCIHWYSALFFSNFITSYEEKKKKFRFEDLNFRCWKPGYIPLTLFPTSLQPFDFSVCYLLEMLHPNLYQWIYCIRYWNFCINWNLMESIENFFSMNVTEDLSQFFTDEPIQRLDSSVLRRLNPRKYWTVKKIIDQMGSLSAKVLIFC